MGTCPVIHRCVFLAIALQTETTCQQPIREVVAKRLRLYVQATALPYNLSLLRQ